MAIGLKIVIKEASKFSIPTVLSACLSLALIPLVAHLYPADEYGKINIFYTTGNLLMTFGLLGFDNALIRFYQKPLKGLGKRESTALCLIVGFFTITCIALLVLFFFSGAVSDFLFGEKSISSLVLLMIYAIALVVFRLCSIIARQEFDAKAYNVQQIFLILSNKALFVLAVLVSSNYFYSILLMTVLTASAAICLFFLEAKSLFAFAVLEAPRESLMEFARFAIPTMPAGVLFWMNSSIAKYVLAADSQFGEAGVFAIAFTIANAFSVIPSAFSIYWSPFVYKNYDTEQALIKRMQDVLTLLAVSLTWLFFCCQGLIYMLVDGAYLDSRQYFMLIMLFPIQTLLVETVGYGIFLSNRTALRLLICAIAVLGNMLLSILLVPLLGGEGAAFALAFSAIIMLSGSLYFGQKWYRSILNTRRTILAYILIVFLCVVNCFVFNSAKMILIVAIAALVFVSVLYRESLRLGLSKVREKIEALR